MSGLFHLFLCFRSYSVKLDAYIPTFYKIRCILEELYVKTVALIAGKENQWFKIFFLTISYLFSIPINCSNLKFHCPLEVLHVEKIGKNIFPGWKKNCSTWKNIFPSWKFFFSHFSTRKDRKS